MNEVKWIKLSTDIFSNRKIKQIRKLPEGDAIVGVWLQVLCLAGQINDNGMVYFSKDIPYTEEMLSVEFDRPINIIKLAFMTFTNFNMLETIDNILLVSNWEKYQSADKLKEIREQNRLRQREFRSKQSALPARNVTVTLPVTQHNATDIDIDIELDKDIKKVYADSVTMTEVEYQKLVDKFGEGDAIRRINKLSVYKESKGKKYKSDYHTILMWASREDEQKPLPPSPSIPILS